MFDLPEAKRVRREDLKDSDASDWSEDDGLDATLRESLNAQLARSLGLDLGEVKPPSQTRDAEALSDDLGNKEDHAAASEEEDLGEFEFRLFSTADSTAKVVLQSANIQPGEGNLVTARPLSHYLVTSISPELRRQYEFAAVSGQDVLARSRQRWWGLELPWKVVQATSAPKSTTAMGQKDSTSKHNDPGTRKRPGKAKRIALRKREKASRKKEEMTAKQQMSKEEHLKDKKKRLNRLKKLRKRAKDKEKKQAAATGAGEDDAGPASDSDMSD